MVRYVATAHAYGSNKARPDHHPHIVSRGSDLRRALISPPARGCALEDLGMAACRVLGMKDVLPTDSAAVPTDVVAPSGAKRVSMSTSWTSAESWKVASVDLPRRSGIEDRSRCGGVMMPECSQGALKVTLVLQEQHKVALEDDFLLRGTNWTGPGSPLVGLILVAPVG